MSLTISLNPAGEMQVEIPGNIPTHIIIPFSMPGLLHLQTILRARSDNPAAKIGTVGAPTQAQVDEFLAAYRKRNPPIKKPSYLGLDLELDL